MSLESTKKPVAIALGAAFVTTLAATPLANAAANPFAMSELSGGYMVAEMAEGKCGSGKKMEEGKCGSGKSMDESKSSSGMMMEEVEAGTGKTGAEGKCGEGKCGGNKKTTEEDKVGKEGY